MLVAKHIADHMKEQDIRPKHILLATLLDGDNAGCSILNRLGIHRPVVYERLHYTVTPTMAPGTGRRLDVPDSMAAKNTFPANTLSPLCKRLLALATVEAAELPVGPEHLLAALVLISNEDEQISFLRELPFQLSIDDVRAEVKQLRS